MIHHLASVPWQLVTLAVEVIAVDTQNTLANVIFPEKWRDQVAQGTLRQKYVEASTRKDVVAAEPTPNLRARFIPLAESRTAAVLAALDYLGQLSQRARYRYTDQEVEEIESAITEKLADTMDAFRRGTGNRPGFRFGKPGRE